MVMRVKRVFGGGERWTLTGKMVKITLIDEIDLDFYAGVQKSEQLTQEEDEG